VLSEVVGAAAPRLQAAGMSVFTLAHADPGHVAEAADTAVDVARDWVRAARLMTLRGIGAANARALEQAGVPSVDALARADARELAGRLRQAGVPRITDARVRVWVRAARRQAGGGS
jgi:predicted flap endonuclease-1-like 5' DNA nuclease